MNRGPAAATARPKSSAVYAIVVGCLMAAMWTFFLASGQVPELASEPVRIALHLAGEFATAALLVVSGAASLGSRPWGAVLLPFALGMLAYTVIVSPGYYAQRGEPAFVALFAVLLVLTLLFFGLAARRLLSTLPR